MALFVNKFIAAFFAEFLGGGVFRHREGEINISGVNKRILSERSERIRKLNGHQDRACIEHTVRYLLNALGNNYAFKRIAEHKSVVIDNFHALGDLDLLKPEAAEKDPIGNLGHAVRNVHRTQFIAIAKRVFSDLADAFGKRYPGYGFAEFPRFLRYPRRIRRKRVLADCGHGILADLLRNGDLGSVSLVAGYDYRSVITFLKFPELFEPRQ